MTGTLPNLSDEDRRILLRIAREAIRRRGEGLADVGLALDPGCALQSLGGVFVTLMEGENMRGCIGHLRPDLPIWEAVSRMACEAALHDPRFEPVVPEELPRLRIEISVLTEAEEVKTVEEVMPGRDGLIVEGLGRRGLLLPQVAGRRNWDAVTFLEQTCWKAGLYKDAWREEGVRIQRFQALVFSEPPLAQEEEVID